MKGRKQGFLPMNQLITWILVIVAFIFISAFVIKLLITVEDGTPEQVCRASVVTRANLYKDLTALPDIKNIFPMQCETQDKIVPEEISSRLTDEQKEDLVMEEIGDMMAKCWFMFGNGRFFNLLNDNWKNSKSCHVCYSFSVSRQATPLVTGELTAEELITYLYTHPYRPGLLMSEGAVVGDSGTLSFKPQDIRESSIESRQLTETRLLASQSRLQLGIADFTGIYSEDAAALSGLRAAMSEISSGGELQPVLVIIPSLPEESWQAKNNIAFALLRDWGVGDSEFNNGMVFVYSLNDGKFAYATDIGSSAIFPPHLLEDAYSESITHFETDDSKEAIGVFVEKLSERVEEVSSSTNIISMIGFQKTYGAYISGGSLSAQGYGSGHGADFLENIQARGAIAFSDDLVIKAGERYDVLYINNLQQGCHLFFGWEACGDSRLPNMIGIANHEDLVSLEGQGKLCNLNYG